MKIDNLSAATNVCSIGRFTTKHTAEIVPRNWDPTWLHEVLIYAGVIAEEALQPWRRRRRIMNSGLDAYGGALVILRIADRRLLNALKDLKSIKKAAYSGDWVLKETWQVPGQEAGSAIAMADAAVTVLNESLQPHARARVASWLS